MEKTICFIIVHYENVDLTKKCISYLENQKYKNIMIVCVDNASSNGSGELLKKYYANKPNIFILLNDRNDGYAKGCNFAYNFVLGKFDQKPCCIVAINNDTFIKDINFSSLLLEKLSLYKDKYIICPDILTSNNNIHQNPLRTTARTGLNLLASFMYNWLMFLLTFIFPNLFLRKFAKAKKKLNNSGDFFRSNDSINFVPHGACIIYTSNWICKEKILYTPYTFLFGEEELLCDYLNIKKYNIVYDKNLSVYHVGDATIGKAVNMKSIRRKYSVGHEVSFNQLRLRIRKKI